MTASAFFKPQALALQLSQITHVALLKVDPGDDNNLMAEVQLNEWPAYTRIPVAAHPYWTEPMPFWTEVTRFSDDEWGVENMLQVNFPQHDGAADVSVSYIGYYDAPVGGNLLARAAMATPKTIHPGDGAACAVGSLHLRVR